MKSSFFRFNPIVLLFVVAFGLSLVISSCGDSDRGKGQSSSTKALYFYPEGATIVNNVVMDSTRSIEIEAIQAMEVKKSISPMKFVIVGQDGLNRLRIMDNDRLTLGWEDEYDKYVKLGSDQRTLEYVSQSSSVMNLVASYQDVSGAASVRTTLAVTTVDDSGESESLAAFTARTLDEFMRLSRVPRPSLYCDKFLAYLELFAAEHNLDFQRDDYGNVWFDLPAKPGYESLPKVIVQAHYDMVCISDPDYQIDFKEEGIVPVLGPSTITAEHTSLGSDDGIGVAIMLALVEADVPHGAVRLLFTADEESGLDGARELPAEVLDAKYLINLDNENVDDVCCSCAGYLGLDVTKDYMTEPLQGGESGYLLTVEGLIGGHSGADIDKNRLSAISCMERMVSAIRGAGLGARLVSFDAGQAVNAIAQSGQCVIALSNEELARQAIAAEVDALAAEYPQENIVWNLKIADALSALSQADSDEMLEMGLMLPQGVLAMSEKIPGLVRTSSNVGIVRLEQGKTLFSNFSRSNVYADLLEILDTTRSQAEEKGFSYAIISVGPCWDGDPQQPLVQLMQRAFREATQSEPQIMATHGTLESGWFVDKSPELQMVSIGPTLIDVHTTGETVVLDTLEPTIAHLLFCLKHIAEI